MSEQIKDGGPVAWLCQAPDDGTRTAVIAKALADMVERNGWTVTPLYTLDAAMLAARGDA